MTSIILLFLMVYSHQESPLVHLRSSSPLDHFVQIWTKYKVDLFFGVVHFHTALFASEPEIVNKMTRVLKVIHSLVHPFSRIRVCLEADRDHLFSWVQVFGQHPNAIAVFTPALKIRTKGGNGLEFDSIKPNKTGVNTL